MIKIALDVSGLGGENLTGVGTYTVNLISALQKNQEIEIEGSCRISRYKNKENIEVNSGLQIIKPIIPFISPQCDVFHGTDFWIPKYGNFKKVITIHDLAVYHQDLYEPVAAKYYQKRYEKSLFDHKPNHVIVVSEYIKNEFLNRFPSFEGRVSVVLHGANHIQILPKTVPIYDFQYMVCLGTIEKRKNTSKLYQTFKILKQKNKEIKLVMIGGFGFMDSELTDMISEMKADRNVIFTGFMDVAHIQNIISNALFTVYPSVYEGFGFPIIESMALGVPVVTSDFGAMKEVANNAAFVCDTTKTEAFTDALHTLVENESIRKTCIQKGFERIKQLTWQKCADETVAVYTKISL